MIIYLVSYIQQPKNKDAFFIYGRFRSYKKCKIVYKQLYMAENGHIKGGSNLIWPFFKQNCGVQNHYMAVLNIKLGGLKLGRGMSKSNRICYQKF